MTSPASGLGPTGATLNAVVNPNGADTSYRFQYATDADYDPTNATDPYGSPAPAQDASVAASAGTQLASATIDGLQPGTTYHYRVVATNGLGAMGAGADLTFTTPAEPAPNTAPTADDDVYTVAEDAQLVVEAPGVLDGDALSAVLASGPSNGKLFLQPSGFFLYTPNKDFNGEDSFSYRASDGMDESLAAAVTISVTPVDEPPPSNAAPTIQAISPTPRSEVRDRTPTVRAKVTDSGTDLSKDDIRLWVDGKRVEGFSYDRTKNRLSYTTKTLDRGRHTVLIVARDEQRLSSSRFWGFRVLKR